MVASASPIAGGEAAVAQLHRREVDRHGQLLASLPPDSGLPAGLAQHPLAERPDQAVGLGGRDELTGQHQPALGMVPADQRLDTGEAPGRELELRLVVQHELAPLQRLAQLALEPPARLRLLVHRRLEQAKAVAALRLGAVEGEVGVLEQRVRVLPVLREQGDADAGGDMHLVAVELERGGERAQDLGRQGRGVGGLRELGLHQRELVAAEPGQGVAGADRARDPAGHRAQQLVADRMAERVVDLLEAVEIEEEDRGHATFAAGMGQGLAEPVEQQGAVRQAGQRVVQGQPPDARLGRLALGQVLEHRDLGDDLARRGAHRRGVDGGDAARPVAAFERDLPARSHLAARHRTGERPVEREAAVAPIGGRRRPDGSP